MTKKGQIDLEMLDQISVIKQKLHLGHRLGQSDLPTYTG